MIAETRAAPVLHEAAADLSVVILTYQVRELALACIDSVLAAAEDLALDVYLVDNGNDGTAAAVRARFPSVAVEVPGANLGFAGGNNVVLDRLLRDATAGRYVLLLNPDTVVRPDTFTVMVRYMDAHPAVGVATCRVELADGTLDEACHRGLPTPWVSFTHMARLDRLWPRSRHFARYHLGWEDLATTHEVEAMTGAFFLARREAFEAVGSLDTAFFMYGEDLDWALRFRQAGWELVYHPATTITHYKGASSGLKAASRWISTADARRRVRSARHFSAAMRVFYDKHYAATDPAVIRVGVRAAIWLRGELVAARYALRLGIQRFAGGRER